MAQVLIDHDRIRQWAEARGGAPASVRGTGSSGDPGLLRIDLPGGAGNDSLQRISWDDWFRKFDAQQLALLIDDDERPTTFNKLVYRHEINIDIDATDRRRGGGAKESHMAKPNRQTDRSRTATTENDPDVERDAERNAGADEPEADEADDTDDDMDDSDDEFDDADTDDDEGNSDDDLDEEGDEGEDEGEENDGNDRGRQ